MSRYIISPESGQDLDEISDYFLSRSIEAGERFVNGFEQKCKREHVTFADQSASPHFVPLR